jgi:hypothetical protein
MRMSTCLMIVAMLTKSEISEAWVELWPWGMQPPFPVNELLCVWKLSKGDSPSCNYHREFKPHMMLLNLIITASGTK